MGTFYTQKTPGPRYKWGPEGSELVAEAGLPDSEVRSHGWALLRAGCGGDSLSGRQFKRRHWLFGVEIWRVRCQYGRSVVLGDCEAHSTAHVVVDLASEPVARHNRPQLCHISPLSYSGSHPHTTRKSGQGAGDERQGKRAKFAQCKRKCTVVNCFSLPLQRKPPFLAADPESCHHAAP